MNGLAIHILPTPYPSASTSTWTVCDTVSAVANQGKIKALKILQ